MYFVNRWFVLWVLQASFCEVTISWQSSESLMCISSGVGRWTCFMVDCLAVFPLLK